MKERTNPHRLTREEGAGYCTALKDMRAWHEGQLTYTSGAIADTHEDAIEEINRLIAMQSKETFGK